ncbi:MAG: site-2 protease family protein [candidate division WOR-3 bacterium]|nr:site-2 protease family protein [candidate division WOR-3 bacterium]MDW7987552.1 site-2 protease family protein [candidate division WOR-3 bacterium]
MIRDFSSIIISAPAILFCVTIHEYAHAFAAYKLGDPTAKNLGRLTLNPFAHLDLIGTIALLLFRVGWAKPVPINPIYFRVPRRDILISSLAGPGANFLCAMIFGLCLRVLLRYYVPANFLILIIVMLFYYNIILGTFNLIPIPPLDGSKIVYYLLGEKSSQYYLYLEQYGLLILVGIIMLSSLLGFSLFSILIEPVIKLFSKIFIGFVL